jgi:uncharacterized protein YbjT (DUF2867 family)
MWAVMSPPLCAPRGEQVRVTSRNPGTAGFAPQTQVVAADLERPETLPAALHGAEKVFLYSTPDGVQGFVGGCPVRRSTARGVAVVGRGRPQQTAPIHEKDTAALAVTALTEPGDQQRSYTVYGPESLTVRQQVEHIGDAIGRKIDLEVISVEDAPVELGKTIAFTRRAHDSGPGAVHGLDRGLLR